LVVLTINLNLSAPRYLAVILTANLPCPRPARFWRGCARASSPSGINPRSGHVSGSPALYGDFTWRIAAATFSNASAFEGITKAIGTAST